MSEFVAITIKVSKPVIVNHPTSIINVSLHTTVSLSCKAMSYDHVSIEWKRVGLDLPITADTTEAKSRHAVTSFLNITRTVGYYAGQYYCVATNNVGSTSSNYSKLIVKVPCPEMIRPPENIRVLPGQTADFYCLALSYSGLLYRWRRYDKHFIANTTTARWLFLRYYTAVQHLFIANVQLSDEGRYCCEAINECGLTKGCAWLDVLRIPKIIEHPSSVKLPGNKKAVEAMNCLATGEGNLNYSWEKYYSSTDSWKAMNITSPKLIFSVITEEDEGVYRCVTTNDDGSVVSGNATIAIYGPPVINFITNNTVTLEDINANLTCIATNDANAIAPLSVVWYNSEDVKLHSDHTIDSVTGQVQSVLLFDPVNHTDSGEYTCHAFNDNDQYTEARTNLTVEYLPIINITEGSSYLATVGQNLTITCKAEGLPTPTVQWYIKDEPIKNTADVSMQDLNVPTTSPHTTVYTCVSTNNAGGVMRTKTDNITITVRATCQPLSSPKNGQLRYLSSAGRPQVAVFFCDDGSIYFLTCIDGKWSPSPPACH